MTTEIAALNRVLADATVECPVLWCEQAGGQTFLYEGPILEGCLPCKRHPTDCICQGTGRIARFKGFRHTPCDFCGGDTTSPCEDCDDKRYLVRAGGLEDGLAGLPKAGLHQWDIRFHQWILELPSDIPAMPNRDAIRLKGLRLVCLQANLIRPCLRHGGGEWAGGPTCSECEALGGYVVIEIAGLEVPDA